MSLTSSRASLLGQEPEPELARGLALQPSARQELLAQGSLAWGPQQAWSPQEQPALHPLGASPSPHPQALAWESWQPQALGWQEPQVQRRRQEVP